MLSTAWHERLEIISLDSFSDPSHPGRQDHMFSGPRSAPFKAVMETDNVLQAFPTDKPVDVGSKIVCSPSDARQS